jgi:hypothetical protein
MTKNIFDMTRKEFEAVPDREFWGNEISCHSLVLIPLKEKHESGFRYITIVAVGKDNLPICKVTTYSDVIHLEGIGGYGHQWITEGGIPDKVTPKQWDIDCLPVSGLFRLFSRGGIIAGNAVSSFECWCDMEKKE